MYGMYTVFERERHHYFILSMAILIGSDMKIFINNLLQCNTCILPLNALNKPKSEWKEVVWYRTPSHCDVLSIEINNNINYNFVPFIFRNINVL